MALKETLKKATRYKNNNNSSSSETKAKQKENTRSELRQVVVAVVVVVVVGADKCQAQLGLISLHGKVFAQTFRHRNKHTDKGARKTERAAGGKADKKQRGGGKVVCALKGADT